MFGDNQACCPFWGGQVGTSFSQWIYAIDTILSWVGKQLQQNNAT